MSEFSCCCRFFRCCHFSLPVRSHLNKKVRIFAAAATKRRAGAEAAAALRRRRRQTAAAGFRVAKSRSNFLAARPGVTSKLAGVCAALGRCRKFRRKFRQRQKNA